MPRSRPPGDLHPSTRRGQRPQGDKGAPVKVVSERLGHASATITLQVYAHVMPGNQRQAADLFASLITEAKP